MLMPQTQSQSRSKCTAAAVTVLPLLSMRIAFNEAKFLSEPDPDAEVEEESHKHVPDNNDKGVAWYVERAAEEDINARLIREVKDLKQLLGGRTAQVDYLSVEIANLQQQLNDKNKSKNSSTFLSQPGDVDVSFSPSLMSTQAQTVKVASEMQFEDLKLEAMARGMDSTTVLKMTKETLVQKLVVGTMCISKSKAWSKVVSLRHDIENHKAAICEQKYEKQQEQDVLVLDKKCKLPKQEIQMCLVTETEKEAHHHHQDQDKLKTTTTTDVADTGSINGSSLKVKAHRIANAKWQPKTEIKGKATPPPPPAPVKVKCPRKGEDGRTITMGKVSPLSRKLDNILFEIHDDDDDDDDNNDDDNTTNTNTTAELHSAGTGSGSGYLSLSLAGLDDKKNTHPSHALIRRHILEAFITPAASALAVPNTKHQDGGISISGKRKLQRQQRYAGFVGLRCRHCKHRRIDEKADLAVIYPESIGGIYRANIRFQRKHIQACSYIPKRLKRKLISLKKTRQSNNRGKRSYWEESALQKGFRNWTSPTGRNGIVFRPEKLKIKKTRSEC